MDKQKEKITFWRTLFFFLLATLFAFVAFVFNRYDTLDTARLILANIAGVLLLIGIIATGRRLKEEIDKIELRR